MPQVRLGVSPESLKAPEPVEEDLYTFRVEGFKPELTQKKDKINYNPQIKIVQGEKTGGKNTGKPLFESLNSAAGWIQNDFVHSLGLEMEKQDDGSLAMPGSFDAPTNEQGETNMDPTTWKYNGPMIGRTGKAYVIKQEYKDKNNQTRVVNKVKYYVCAVADCNKKYPDVVHSKDLAKG